MTQHRSIDDYDNAEDAMTAASKMEMHGDWEEALELYHCAAARWPEHLPYITECVAAVHAKQQLSRLDSRVDVQAMTVGEWMGTLLILSIPIINVLMCLIWAFGSSGNLNRKTFCQATLVWFVIVVLATLLLRFAGVERPW